jgi:hypothetical protein
VKIVEKKAGESREEYDRRIDQAMRSLSHGKWKMENTIIAALGIGSWMLWDPANKYTPTALKAE